MEGRKYLFDKQRLSLFFFYSNIVFLFVFSFPLLLMLALRKMILAFISDY